MSSIPTAQGAPQLDIVCGSAMGQSMKLTKGINDFQAPPALSSNIGKGTLSQSFISEEGRGGVSIGGSNMGTKQLGASEAQAVYAAPTSNMGAAGIGESHEQSALGM